MQWSPLLFLPAPMQAFRFPSIASEATESTAPAFSFADFRFKPHYPAKSPLDEVLSRVVPGTDEYVTEKYAFEIKGLLDEWSQGLRVASPALSEAAKLLDA